MKGNKNKNKCVNKSKQNYNYRKDARSEDRDIQKEKASYNDASWYSLSEEMLKNAARFSFYTPQGTALDLTPSSVPDESGTDWVTVPRFVLPGVMALRVGPSVGFSNNRESDINVAAFKMYSWVRHLNSGSSNYEAPDLMMYVLATSELYASYQFLARTYGLLATYSQVNRFLPRTLVYASGCDYEDLAKNMANFRFWLNVWCSKINSFAVPGDLPYFKRRMWMFTNVYKDSEELKSQYYIHVPTGFWKYEGFKDTKGGKLTLQAWPTGYNDTKFTFDNIVSYMNSLIDVIASDEDMQIMSGDIKKAYASDSLMRLQNISDDYATIPVYNMEVLHQIENSYMLGLPVAGTTDVTQDVTTQDRIIKFGPKFTSTTPCAAGCRLITLGSDAPDPEMVMVATRNSVICGLSAANEGVYTLTPTSLGSDYITSAVLYAAPSDIKGSYEWASDHAIDPQSFSAYTALYVPYFDHHPMMYQIVSYTGNKVSVAPVLTDVQSTAILTARDLEKLHTCAILSLFNVPGATSNM